MLQDLSPPQRALADFMSDLSEDAYCAGWMYELEYELWRLLQPASSRRYGLMTVSDEQIATLKSLSEACHGWIHFDDAQHEIWLPFPEWERLYNAWLARQGAERASAPA